MLALLGMFVLLGMFALLAYRPTPVFFWLLSCSAWTQCVPLRVVCWARQDEYAWSQTGATKTQALSCSCAA